MLTFVFWKIWIGFVQDYNENQDREMLAQYNDWHLYSQSPIPFFTPRWSSFDPSQFEVLDCTEFLFAPGERLDQEDDSGNRRKRLNNSLLL